MGWRQRRPCRSQPAGHSGCHPTGPRNLNPPNVLEYAVGVNRQFGSRAALRADYVFRNYRDCSSQRTDVDGTDRRSRTWGNVNGANHVNTTPTVLAILIFWPACLASPALPGLPAVGARWAMLPTC